MIAFRTSSGRRLDLGKMTASDVTIGDVARGLSLCCRFANQMREHYSVAQHSLLVESLVETPKLKPYARLHDASEAYLGDITYHLKRHPGMSFYREIEADVTRVIHDAFGLAPLTPAEEQEIKHADNLAAIFEHVVLREMLPWTAPAAIHWAVTDGFSKGDPEGMLAVAPRLPKTYRALTAQQAEHLFLMAFAQKD